MMSDRFTYEIIGKAMGVHRELGPGMDEIFYHELLSERLKAAGIEHLFRPREPLIHRGIVADIFEADLIFPGKLVAELKCLVGSFDPEHYVQIICYQKFWRIGTGLLFDFGKESLAHRRVNYEPVALDRFAPETLLQDAPDFANAKTLAIRIGRSMGQILSDHGLGYRDTTYRGLLAAELNAEGLRCVISPTAPVFVQARPLGQTTCDCLTVGNLIAVKVLALRRAISAADIAVLRTHLRLLGLSHGLILNFGKSALSHCWVHCALKAPAETSRMEREFSSLSAPNLWESSGK